MRILVTSTWWQKTNENLKLRNILHVLAIAKNLIIISQLTNSHNVYVEFDSSNCFVKDKVTKKVLLQGRLKDWLYQLVLPVFAIFYQAQTQLSSSPSTRASTSTVNSSCFQSNKCLNPINVSSFYSKETWHRRLGHLSSKVLSQVLRNCNVKANDNSNSMCCSACQYGKSHLLPFQISNSCATQILDLRHTDVWGLPQSSLLLVTNTTCIF